MSISTMIIVAYVLCSYIITGLSLRYVKTGIEECKDEKLALFMFIFSPIIAIVLIGIFISWIVGCLFYYPFYWITGIKL